MPTPLSERPAPDDTWVGLAWMGVAILMIGGIMWLAWPRLSRWDDQSRAALVAPFVMEAALASDTQQALRMANFHTVHHRRGDIIIPPASRYGIVYVDQDLGHLRVSWGPLSPDVCQAVQSVVEDKPDDMARVRISVKEGPSWDHTPDFLKYDCATARSPWVLTFEPQHPITH